MRLLPVGPGRRRGSDEAGPDDAALADAGLAVGADYAAGGAAVRVQPPIIEFLPASPTPSDADEIEIVVENLPAAKKKKKADALRRFFDRAHKRGTVHKR